MQNSIFTPKIKEITNENVEVQRLSHLLMANNIKFCKDKINNVCFLTRIPSFISSYTYYCKFYPKITSKIHILHQRI